MNESLENVVEFHSALLISGILHLAVNYIRVFQVASKLYIQQ